MGAYGDSQYNHPALSFTMAAPQGERKSYIRERERDCSLHSAHYCIPGPYSCEMVVLWSPPFALYILCLCLGLGSPIFMERLVEEGGQDVSPECVTMVTVVFGLQSVWARDMYWVCGPHSYSFPTPPLPPLTLPPLPLLFPGGRGRLAHSTPAPSLLLGGAHSPGSPPLCHVPRWWEGPACPLRGKENRTCEYVHVCACVDACVCVRACACVRACVRAYMRACVRAYMRACVFVSSVHLLIDPSVIVFWLYMSRLID